MNLISDWAKEWLVMVNRTKTEATCFSLSLKREEFILQINGHPPARHPNVPRSEVRQKTDLVSPHQYHAQQRSQESGPDEEIGRIKMGSQHENPDPGLHRNCQTHMEYASSAWSSAERTNVDQLTKTQNAGLRVITGGMKTTPISELEKTAGKERREEKLLRHNEKIKRVPSPPLHGKFEAPTKNRLKRLSPNYLVKALQQKHRIPSSARNQPLEMLQNYEDWQAETPTIILDIPGIQAKDHHTVEELRSLTLEALSVSSPSTTWARAYTDGSAEEAAKNGGGGVFIKLPDGRSIRKSVATGHQSTNYRAEAYALLTAAQTLNQEEILPTNTVFLTDCRFNLQSLQSPGGDQIFSNIRQELSLLRTKHL